jgi:small-conductance mechanosensitive channel
MTETEQTELRHQLRELSRTIAHMLASNEPVREALLQQVQLLNEAWTMPPAEPQPGRGFDLRPTRLRLLACAAGLQNDAATAEEMDEPSIACDIRAAANAILNAARVRGLIPRE